MRGEILPGVHQVNIHSRVAEYINISRREVLVKLTRTELPMALENRVSKYKQWFECGQQQNHHGQED